MTLSDAGIGAGTSDGGAEAPTADGSPTAPPLAPHRAGACSACAWKGPWSPAFIVAPACTAGGAPSAPARSATSLLGRSGARGGPATGRCEGCHCQGTVGQP